MRRSIVDLIVVTSIFLVFSSSFAYQLKTDVLSSGGTEMSFQSYMLSGTFGQFTVYTPELTSPGYKAVIGFWHPPYATGVYEESTLPVEYAFRNCLYQNKPNPVSAATAITYAIARKGYVFLGVFNVLGQRVVTLVDELQEPGDYEVIWNLSSVGQSHLPNGIYFYRIQTQEYTEVKKMVIVR